jgi:hypothetical protein
LSGLFAGKSAGYRAFCYCPRKNILEKVCRNKKGRYLCIRNPEKTDLSIEGTQKSEKFFWWIEKIDIPL